MTIPKHLMEAKICNKDTCEEIRTLKDCCTDAYETGQEIINDLEKENQRLNNVLNELEKELIESGVTDEIMTMCGIYDVNGIALRKLINELKESDK